MRRNKVAAITQGVRLNTYKGHRTKREARLAYEAALRRNEVEAITA